jgi:fibro-slime domain-containing protein
VLLGPEEPRCGDGIVDENEVCDDLNAESGDGCRADCEQIEEGFVCRTPSAACERARICGDGRQTSDEDCDDGNVESDDGCTSSCLIEKDFVCPTPGERCLSTVECGDGSVSGDETCDDANTSSGDGCSELCETEAGWTCSSPAAPCLPICGDALLVGRESCDDGDTASGNGCSAECSEEPGWVCDEPGEACRLTVCGDGEIEGSEPCDDGGNLIVGDGCSPGCVLEPDCTLGPCVSRCGDGLILAGDDEICDDGNNVSGDGCSDLCQPEDGYTCDSESDALPEQLNLPILYRDFIHAPTAGAVRHPDFQEFFGRDVTQGLVASALDAEGKPAYTGACEAGTDFTIEACPYGAMTTSQADFEQWYRDTDGVSLPLLQLLDFRLQPDGTYVFEIDNGLFPFDGGGWVLEGSELTSPEDPDDESSLVHNYGFTSELRHWFEFQGDEFLEFSGDDDVWVFIGGQLVVDIGGLHPRQARSVTLDPQAATNLGLEIGRVYEVALFHAERRTELSNFKLSLKGFNSSKTTCVPECGDGIAVATEACDDGADNGTGYGFCTELCEFGPRCGDGVLDQDSPEECDNGINLDGYATGDSACSPGCLLPPHCGDGTLDVRFGEECDAGEGNDGSYGGCAEDCILAPRCGDGQVDEDDGEECDDGNQRNDDSCDVECKRIVFGPAQ